MYLDLHVRTAKRTGSPTRRWDGWGPDLASSVCVGARVHNLKNMNVDVP